MEILLKDKDYRANVIDFDIWYKVGYKDGVYEGRKELAIRLKEVGLVTEQMLDDYLKVRFFRRNLRIDIFYDMGHRDGKTKFLKHMARKMKGLGYATDVIAKVTNIPARRIAKYTHAECKVGRMPPLKTVAPRLYLSDPNSVALLPNV